MSFSQIEKYKTLNKSTILTMQLLKYTVAFFIVFNLVSARVIGGREFEEIPSVIRNGNGGLTLGREIMDPSVDVVQSFQQEWAERMGRINAQKPYKGRLVKATTTSSIPCDYSGRALIPSQEEK